MNTFETSATVEDQGRVQVAGVPFAPGTEVEVTISPKVRSAAETTRSGEAGVRPATGLCWEGKVLVHQGVGVGAGPSADEVQRR